MEEETVTLPDSIAEAYFKEDFKPIKMVYIDIEILQDIYLGNLICNTTTSKEIEYIDHMIPEYNNRYDDDVEKYFPVLKVTADQIKNTFDDKDKHRDIILSSPWTTFHANFPNFLYWILEHNQRCAYTGDINIYIGNTTIDYPQDLKSRLTNQINNFNPRLKATMMNRDFMGIDECDLFNIDIALLNNIAYYIKNDKFNNYTMEELKFQTTKIFSYPVITETILEGQTAEELLTNFRKLFSIFTQFFYIHRGVFIT